MKIFKCGTNKDGVASHPCSPGGGSRWRGRGDLSIRWLHHHHRAERGSGASRSQVIAIKMARPSLPETGTVRISRFNAVLARPQPTTAQKTRRSVRGGLQAADARARARGRRPDPDAVGQPVVLTEVRKPWEGDHAGGRRGVKRAPGRVVETRSRHQYRRRCAVGRTSHRVVLRMVKKPLLLYVERQ